MSMKTKRAKVDLGIYGIAARWYDRISRKFRSSDINNEGIGLSVSLRK